MPNRMLRDWTNSDKIDNITCEAERFFTRLIMKADDYGCFFADPTILRANLFPKKIDKILNKNIITWLGECEGAQLLQLYTDAGKPYLEILDFQQRLDRAKRKFPIPPPLSDTPQETVNDLPREQRRSRKRDGDEKEDISPSGDDLVSIKKNYSDIEKTKNGIFDFIKKQKPLFPEPYVEYWNIFAGETGLAKIKVITDDRKRKLLKRLKEPAFTYTSILRKASQSEFLLNAENNWFSFDWIVKNEQNYLKIIEGNYDKHTGTAVKIKASKLSGTVKEIKNGLSEEKKGAA